MSHFTHEGTDALKRLADEVEHERVTKGHTPFDAVAEDDDTTGSAATRRGHAGDEGTGAATRAVTPQPPH